MFDIDKSGTIDSQELGALMKLLGIDMPESEVYGSGM